MTNKQAENLKTELDLLIQRQKRVNTWCGTCEFWQSKKNCPREPFGVVAMNDYNGSCGKFNIKEWDKERLFRVDMRISYIIQILPQIDKLSREYKAISKEKYNEDYTHFCSIEQNKKIAESTMAYYNEKYKKIELSL